jgi:uncharacterized membrane protein
MNTDPAEPTEADRSAAERLTFFSDAVVAIALTLLALELPVPSGSTNAEALHSLDEHLAEYIAFLISFAVIAVNWQGHHRVFRHVAVASVAVVRWNLLWLLMIVLTPFAARVIVGQGAFQVRFIFYALVQALSGAFFLLIVRAIDRTHALAPDAPPGIIPNSYRRLGVVTAMFAISIPLSFVTQWAYLCWTAIPLVFVAVRLVGRRRGLH